MFNPEQLNPRSSDGADGRHRGEANPPQQGLEPWIVPQAIQARIYMKVDKPVGVLFVGFLQAFHRSVVFSQADVDSGEKVGRDILLLRQFYKIIEYLNCF